jgi:peptidoglycan-associated lipoprotein
MRQIRRGPGGLVSNGNGLRLARWVGTLVVAVALVGCSSKKPANPNGGLEGQNGSQLGEGTINGSSSSLEQFKHGTLGAGGSGGPLSDIHFDYDDYTVRPQDGEVLRSNAQWLASHGGSHVQVEGHTDERGSEEYNLALGAKRAQAAKDYLTTLGVSGDRVSTISYGKELPVCTEHTDDCWAQNRRDHFVVSQAGQ